MDLPIILNLAKPTVGDAKFYDRWRQIGDIYYGWDQSSPEYKQEALDRATVLVVDQHREVTEAFLDQFKCLKFVCSATTGHTHFKFDPKPRGITLVTLKGESDFLSGIWSVAEFTLHLMLRLARDGRMPWVTLRGKTLGIIGYGRIGHQVEVLARAFGMKCYWWDKGSTPDNLKKLFSFCDFLSVHLEENLETIGLIGDNLISSMRRTSFLINTARESIVDTKALCQSVASGRIAGAAIDTTTVVTPHPNLIVTPHIAGSTLEDRIKTDEFICQKLGELLAQNTPKRRVTESR